jgi:acyl-CoA thioesterase-1
LITLALILILEPGLGVSEKTILVLGDSLTAGYGIDPDDAYPALLQKKVAERSLAYKVVNGGLSGETSAGGLRRVDWLLKRKVDVLILELGANDGLRGISLDSTRTNLQGIIDKVRAANPKVKIVIAGMMVPPNLGPQYTSGFREIFEKLAEENNASLIPFLLDGVAGDPQLNLPDGIHPTAEGHRIIVETVWKVLEPLL